jgi:prepilin-type N-terminal cleavage/methylation domain-containing protein
MNWFSRRIHAARIHSGDASGFSLIEVIVALSLILFVMTSSVVFFVRSMQTSATQQVREAAVSLADQATELPRSVPAASLLNGRDKGRSDTQWAALPAAAAAMKAVSQEVWDSTATGSSTPLVKFSTADTTTLVNKTQFTVNVAIGKCWISTTTSVVCNVPSPIPAAATPLYRIIVDVHWTAKIGEYCPTTGCDYIVTTLRDPSTDPLFNSNGG